MWISFIRDYCLKFGNMNTKYGILEILPSEDIVGDKVLYVVNGMMGCDLYVGNLLMSRKVGYEDGSDRLAS